MLSIFTNSSWIKQIEQNKYGHKTYKADFSLNAKPYHMKQVAVEQAYQDLSKTSHDLVNGEDRITYLFWRKSSCSVVLVILSSNSPSSCSRMEDSWSKPAQRCLKVSNSRFSIAELEWKQSEKELLQQGNGGWLSFKMWFGWWRNEGYSSFFKGFAEFC